MSSTDDFTSATTESSSEDSAVKPAEFPRHFLGSISLYVMLALFCSVGAYLIVWYFPSFLNLIYTDINQVEIRTAPFIAVCTLLTFGVPLLASLAFRKYTLTWMFSFLMLIAVVFGAGLAFICVPLGWNVILLPVLVLALSHWILAFQFHSVEELHTGKFAKGFLLSIAFILLFIAELFLQVNWLTWAIATAFFFITTIIGYNLRKMKNNYQTMTERNLPFNEAVLAEALNQFLSILIFIFPLVFVTHRFRVTARKRLGIRPEDGR